MPSDTPAHADQEVPLRARDLMTAAVLSVGPDEPVQRIAQLLLDNGISAVPVVTADGTPIGMVSEGDLIGRDEQDRVARHDWWLGLVTGRQPLDDAFQARIQAADRVARDVMGAPLVTVTEDTPADRIARLLATYHIKRVPVLREDRIVGIVSRADLLRAVAAPSPASPHKPSPANFLHSLFGDYHRPAWEAAPAAAPQAAPQRRPVGLTADDFRHLVEDFHQEAAQHRDDTRRAAAAQRREHAKVLIDAHVFDETWRQFLHQARQAAEKGETEALLLRFPSILCLDTGRAINTAEQDWPATLRGEPAELYLRWERELKPRRFTLSARVLEFPDGKPGDVGLFLGWAAG